MSFGFGIGDFLTVFKLATEARDRWTDAPKEYKSMKDEYADFPSTCQLSLRHQASDLALQDEEYREHPTRHRRTGHAHRLAQEA